jgi:hypothetical protein
MPQGRDEMVQMQSWSLYSDSFLGLDNHQGSPVFSCPLPAFLDVSLGEELAYCSGRLMDYQGKAHLF